MLKEGDKVYLLRQNVKTKRLSRKLDYKKLSVFTIKRTIGLVNFELDLSKSIKIYLVFYISLLEPALPNVLLVILELAKENEGQEYIVEEVINKRTINREH